MRHSRRGFKLSHFLYANRARAGRCMHPEQRARWQAQPAAARPRVSSGCAVRWACCSQAAGKVLAPGPAGGRQGPTRRGVLVDGEGGRGVLHKEVGQPHLELGQLGQLQGGRCHRSHRVQEVSCRPVVPQVAQRRPGAARKGSLQVAARWHPAARRRRSGHVVNLPPSGNELPMPTKTTKTKADSRFSFQPLPAAVAGRQTRPPPAAAAAA